MANDERHTDDRQEAQRRLLLPLAVPALAFLFAALFIYGLSRVYLELNEFAWRDVTMATPAALGVSLIILIAAAYFASAARVTVVQLVLFGVVSAALLTGGSIWAAVREDPVHEEPPVAGGPGNGEEPPGGPPPEGAVHVALDEWSVDADPPAVPPGEVTFAVENVGSIQHNFRTIRTDLEPDALPVDDAAFRVDESQVDVVASSPDLDAAGTADVAAQLDAGSYVLICNIPTHYEQGMYTGFTVE